VFPIGKRILEEAGFGPGAQQQQNTTIEVEVTGDTDVVGDVAAREIESETRDTNRRSGRGLRPGL